MGKDFWSKLANYIEDNKEEIMLKSGWGEEELELFRSGICNIAYCEGE